jgi:putative oxidoreductase
MKGISLLCLRLSLGIVFIWFGIQKLFDVCPVTGMIQNALPMGLGKSCEILFFLGIFELIIGIGFVVNCYIKFFSLAMMAHLLIATTAVLITQGFDPQFPILSIAGEFVVKNFVLIAGPLVIFSQGAQH